MSSAALERLSTLSLSIQQLGHLPHLLRSLSSTPSPRGTVWASDVPSLFREPYILTGYRPTGQDWRCYLLSLFQRHNESLNVWTHLLAVPIVLLSVAAHLLQSHSELAHYTLFFVDYVGVSVYQYGCALAYYFYCSEYAWRESGVGALFLPGAAFLGWLSCAGCCFAKFRYRRPYPPRRKVCQLIPTGLAYLLDISPVAHRLVAFFMLAAFFFSCPVPERFFPGRCDIVGHGHQIFHLFLSLCTFCQLEALFEDYLARRRDVVQVHGEVRLLVACAIFPVLVLCSAMTAAAMRRSVKRRLRIGQD
ncbi:hypothetical protein JZ751_010451 [Albula glossodonta]|uniref:Uncharacterized protein n=1 Tax=Albula glossodonta TaxID=121402 RepID=A0A8T2NX88_9TELE|nr:hypothetical protein JZ751_010451 [Albula glossodonta]